MESKPKEEQININEKYNLDPMDDKTYDFICSVIPNLNTYSKRNLFISSKNISSLTKDNFYLLYELMLSEQTALNLKEVFELNLLKEISMNQEREIVILIADQYYYAKSKKNSAQIKKIAQQKIKNVFSLLSFENPKTNLIHFYYLSDYRQSNSDYEIEVSNYKIKVKYERIKNLFGLGDDDNINLLDYPCYLAVASDPKIYPKIFNSNTKNFSELKALILTDDKNVYRYPLAYHASEILGFKEPSLIVYNSICQLNGNQNDTSFEDVEHNLFSEDDDKVTKKKMLKFSLSGSRGNGTLEEHKKLGGDINVDVACRYLKYFEKDSKIYEEKINGFGKGEISCG
ncbi:MAG: hypothetical protein MJ252_13855, partial [archaeon]|nr:hypothetical protein [archaeon]